MVHSLSIFVSSVGHMVYLFHIRLQIPTKSNAMYDSKNLIKIEKHISISSVHGKTLHGITTLSWPTTRFKSGQSRVSVIHFQVLPVQKWKKTTFLVKFQLVPSCNIFFCWLNPKICSSIWFIIRVGWKRPQTHLTQPEGDSDLIDVISSQVELTHVHKHLKVFSKMSNFHSYSTM